MRPIDEIILELTTQSLRQVQKQVKSQIKKGIIATKQKLNGREASFARAIAEQVLQKAREVRQSLARETLSKEYQPRARKKASGVQQRPSVKVAKKMASALNSAQNRQVKRRDQSANKATKATKATKVNKLVKKAVRGRSAGR